MARIIPFQPYRYTARAGELQHLATQPYDKISPEMRRRYLAASPYNLVRVVLGERFPADNEIENVYTRAASSLEGWIAGGILERESSPSVYPYFQEFVSPDSGERLVRKGFIALGAVEDYSAGVVHRHEQTLSGPKQDRLELLRHTRAQCEQIFMLYSDPEGAVDRLIQEAAASAPLAEVNDEYDTAHRIWRIDDPARITEIQRLMAPRKLIIADGHHRYETAVAFRNESPTLAAAARVPIAYFNMHSPGLRILGTHRAMSGIAGFEPAAFLASLGGMFRITPLASLDELRASWTEPHPGLMRMGVTLGAPRGLYLAESAITEDLLDVAVLHSQVIEGVLGVSAEAVRTEKHIRYIRGIDVAAAEVDSGAAQLAFLLEPASVEQVARIAFSGGVMPQKSTDFYPKLLSGLTIYRM
jgi:uncharacterized protein (DUF1015 family)